LTQAARTSAAGPDEPDRELIEQLIEQLRDLRPGRSGPQETTEHAAASRPTPESEEEILNLLAPPQGEREIGRLGPYRVLRALGRGGVGVGFGGEDTQLRRLVALKVMRPTLASNEAARQRFLREAQATAALEHDHIVAIHQVGEADGVPWLAMQLLHGETL